MRTRTPNPVPLSELTHPRSTFEEFKAFLLKQNVLALAIAVVVGAALNDVVKAIVDGLIMPIVTAIGGDKHAAWRTYVTPGPIGFQVGAVLSAVVTFLLVGLVAWRLTKIFIKPEPAAAKPSTKDCQFCRMTIDAAATRCPHCTSQL